MAGSNSPTLPISLFDIFLGSGRTIRRPTGPPGTGQTELVQVRPSRRASVQKQASSDESKAASTKGSNKENAPSGSKHSSKKDDSKPNSKPTTEKAASNNKAADTTKAAEEPKTNRDKPQAGAQNPSGPVFTPEEDAKILLMNGEGKKWPEIAAAIGKPKKQVTKRFGQIRPADWQPQKGGKPNIDKAGVSDANNDKQVTKMGKTEDQVEARKTKSNTIDKHKFDKERALSAALLVAGKVEHAHAHRHEVHVNHHIHNQDTHPQHSPQDLPPRRHKPRHETQPLHPPPPTPKSLHPPPTPKSHRLPPPASIASSRTAYTLATEPSLTEDDLFSFGELQALSELIGKDMEGTWQRVSAAFFGMTGRRIAAEDIREKFEGLNG
ncbi:hypothetical protein E4T44_08539 [Aureobasidium sp. EXF-8845]|nr:hypothetical protein E4T44_08539 [Aureobasidium sp. EXF-8845]KAI4843729.1 hypothetical protein E4T45_08475 [Aureobasidium sp. EXF-8846]